MTDQIKTVTMTDDQMAAFESGRKIGLKAGLNEAAKIARDWWDGCEAETPHQLIEQAIRALSMPAALIPDTEPPT